MVKTVVFGSDTAEFFLRFVLLEKIGLGGFATVHKGLDRLNNSFVAIKEVDKTHYSPTDSSLEREVYILSEVQHSNIVKLICTYVTPSKVFIVTELAAGGELLERIIEHGKFAEEDARSVIHQVLQGVEYLHMRKVVHRDLKLENILLSDKTPQAKVKIADFGLARFFADDSELRTICGSPLYVAPEILDIGTSSETYTPAVDMWSVGVILFILLSVRKSLPSMNLPSSFVPIMCQGNSPFENEDEQVLFRRIRSGDYSMDDCLWDYISAGAKDCVRQLLVVS
uniref:Protein kinase domain-containing protein n=2 Tax=Micromonas pusilla TaxID=38833 RepID=A0A6U0RIX2_MICPS|mmetsp:Transcript_9907/g.40614  ORF Transcript_9907/g.40614 Transcript_9907/m.40614 type:complete len:283 (+) Transcript_9907:177-1025(+)